MNINETPTCSNNLCTTVPVIMPQPEHVTGLRALWQEAFGDTDAFLDTFFSTAFSPERCLCIVKDKHIAAALYWFECEYKGQPLAYIYAVATAKAYRGNGLCKKLLEATHHKLNNEGYIGALLVPGSKSLFQFYSKLGYQTCCYRHIYEYNLNSHTGNIDYTRSNITQMPADSFSLEEISASEYALLRKNLLPANSIIQEKENLTFLQTQLTFYKSNDFIFAAHTAEQVLYCPELLYMNIADQTSSISKNFEYNSSHMQLLSEELLSYFGCTKGTFCVPGTTTAFAMYHSLNAPDIKTPEYFAFAYD